MNQEFEELQQKLNDITTFGKSDTFLSILNRSNDENMISRLVAFVLDPTKTTPKILEKLLLETQSKQDAADFVALFHDPENRFRIVQPEKQISPRSRLDILIQFSKFWIVIENKIDADETGKQSLNYEEDLQHAHVPIKYIFLKPEYNPHSLQNKHFTLITYTQLAAILKSISMADFKQPENYVYL